MHRKETVSLSAGIKKGFSQRKASSIVRRLVEPYQPNVEGVFIIECLE